LNIETDAIATEKGKDGYFVGSVPELPDATHKQI
jgi:predicted RNase H-like HicB family nuclease